MSCSWGAMWGSTRVVRRQRTQRNCKSLSYGFHGKEQADLGLASLEKYPRFLGIGTALGCLALGPRGD